MRILFVSSCNNKGLLNPIIINQANSLTNLNVSITHFGILEKGIKGYLKNIFKLKKYLRKNKFDIIHAHYSFSAIVSFIASKKIPVIASLMGSDIYQSKIGLCIVRFFIIFFWKTTIVKTINMKEKIGFKNAKIIPNGVNIKNFKPIDKLTAREKLNWSFEDIHILFGANSSRFEKNFDLVSSSIDTLKNKYSIQIHCLNGIPHEDAPLYMNASDVVVLSSLWEGSPNVIKEALACNRPIVSTNVGDVELLLKGLKGCYISESNTIDFSKKLDCAIKFSINNQQTNGRLRINDLKIDSNSIANTIYNLYKEVI